MSPFNRQSLRDPEFRRRFEQKLAEIQAVREKHRFLEYATQGDLFEELEAIYQENQAAYEKHFLKNQQAFQVLREQVEAKKDQLHPIRYRNARRWYEQIEQQLGAFSYAENGQAVDLMEKLSLHLDRSLSEMEGWKQALATWQEQLAAAKSTIFNEAYPAFHEQWRNAQASLHSPNQLPKQPLEMDGEGLRAAQQARVDAFADLTQLAHRFPRYQAKVAELSARICSESETDELREELLKARRSRWVRGGAAAALFLLVLAGGAWLGPLLYQGQQEAKVWEKSKQAASVAAYRNYLQVYPGGVYADSAERALLALPSGSLPDYTDGQGQTMGYEGELRALVPQGDGFARYENGATYQGHFEAGIRDSFGTYVEPDGTHYVGEWQGGVREGEGRQTFVNGDTYDGEWQHDLYHGTGTLDRADGSVYRGQWRAGRQAGKGFFQAEDGSTYDGSWHDGQYHGKGRFTDTARIVYRGQWQKGFLQGEGRQEWPDGRLFQGNWENGKKAGTGTVSWPQGGKFRGQWRADSIYGPGEFTDRFRVTTYNGFFEGTLDQLVLKEPSGQIIKRGKIEGGLFVEMEGNGTLLPE